MLHREKLFTSTWQNTGMKNQVIWIYQTKERNGKLGDKVGKYSALSADHQRIYHVIYGDTAVDIDGFVYYAEDPVHFEDGNTPQSACNQFIMSCEEVFFGNYTDVYFKDMAEAMIDMSDRFGLGWQMEELYSVDSTITNR